MMSESAEAMLRIGVPLGLAAATAWGLDALSTQRRLQPPGLQVAAGRGLLRRPLFLAVFTVGFFLTVFQSVAVYGLEAETDLSGVPVWQLFWVHALLLGLLSAWYLLGFAGVEGVGRRLSSEWWRQLGLASPRIGREIAIGLLLGVIGWGAVLLTVSIAGMVITAVGGAQALPDEVPPSIVWMASLSIPVRFAIALSAGVVEELFFRGFLQPRVGIGWSCLLFVLAHLSYGQPFLLLGVSLLSLGFAFLARWRGNIWAAITAHFVFDAVQLLILIPSVLEFAGEI